MARGARAAPRFSLRARMLLFSVFLASAVGVLGWYSHAILQDFRHDGPVYGPLRRGQDLLADVLPPPEYIIESYLLVLELSALETPDDRRVDEILRIGRELEAQYYARHAYWSATLEGVRSTV